MQAPPPLKTFIVYSSLDRDLRTELERHLLPLVDLGWLEVWSDKAILPGEVWDKAIKEKLAQADLFLLLVSVDFYNSGYIREEEFKTAIARLESGDSLVIPVIVRPCTWKYFPVIKDLQVLPSGGKAVTDTDHWKSRDKAWDNVVEMIGERVELMRGGQVEIKSRVTESVLAVESRKAKADPFHEHMVLVKSGTFEMGSMGSNTWKFEMPIHKVILSDFWLCKYPVTQGMWKAVMGKKNNPSYFKGDDKRPVENVSWNDIQTFIRDLNQKTNGDYRLPSEAEWEYAARGGSQSNGYKYAGSNDLKEVGWYADNPDSWPHPVGKKKPNELGFYDMSGNVWEWCKDVWHGDYKGAPTDGSAWVSGGDSSRRVVRGGSWNHFSDDCRVASRAQCSADFGDRTTGFRLAKSAQP